MGKSDCKTQLCEIYRALKEQHQINDTFITIPILEDMGIMKYFEVIIGRQEVINPKPHKEPIIKAINSMNVDNNNYNIFMIGDTKLDLICANESDVEAVGVLSGYGTKDELELYTKLIFDNSLDAVKHITSLHK
jgi:phosphoglycolate phosphatase-like HAD superfamily hydrolase